MILNFYIVGHEPTPLINCLTLSFLERFQETRVRAPLLHNFYTFSKNIFLLLITCYDVKNQYRRLLIEINHNLKNAVSNIISVS